MNEKKTQPTQADRSPRLTAGVQLDHDALRLVAIQHGRIRAWAAIPYPPSTTPESEIFPDFFKQALARFRPSLKQAQIWALGAFPSLQLRFFSVPRTRAGNLSSLVYWTYRKDIPFDAAQTIFDYDVEGSVAQDAAHPVNVTAYSVAQAEVDALRSLFERAGYRLDGIVIPHVAMRNLFRAHWLNHDPTVMGLYVGESSSTLQVLCDGHVALARVFITGMNAILDVLRDRNPSWSQADAYQALLQAEKTETTEIRDLIRPALGRLMQQVERTMAAFLVGAPPQEITRIHVMGALAALPQRVAEMGAQWGIKTQPADVFQLSRLDAGVHPPSDSNASALMTLAAGVALSTPRQTPNLLHTYVKRDRENRSHRIQAVTAASAAGILALVAAGYGATVQRNRLKAGELKLLHEHIAQYPEGLNRSLIEQLLAGVQQRHQQLLTLSQKCRPIAMVNQIAELTPDDIRLSAIRIADARDHGRPAPTDGRRGERVALDGMVRGLPETQEARLASYVMRMEDAELFSDVSVARTSHAREGQEPMLLFEMTLRTAPPAQTDSGQEVLP